MSKIYKAAIQIAMDDIYQTIIQIIETTSDGKDLSPRHLKLTEDAANGFLDSDGLKELNRVYEMVKNNQYIDWFHGIEHMTQTHEGYVKWKGVAVDNYTFKDWDTEVATVRQLYSRCLHIESLGLKPSTRNCSYSWDEYENLQSDTGERGYPWVIDDYYENKQKWRRIDQEHFEWYRDCVPPMAMRGDGFLCGEPYTHQNDGQGVYLACREQNGKYYAQIMTLKEFKVKVYEKIDAYQYGCLPNTNSNHQ